MPQVWRTAAISGAEKEDDRLKKNLIWKLLFLGGLCPFLAPLVMGAYTMSVEHGWTWGDWLVLYSFVYWPTYVIGGALIILAVWGLRRGKNGPS